MAAVAVLAIMIVFLANVFSNSSKIWKLGNKRVESNNNGRAAIEFVAHEISSAIVNGQLMLQVINSGSAGGDSLALVSSSGTPQDFTARNFIGRQIKLDAFKVIPSGGASVPGTFSLVMHNRDTPTLMKILYDDPSGWGKTMVDEIVAGNSSVIAENVRSFRVFVYDVAGNTPNNYVSGPGTPPPLFIDIYLEVLAEEDAAKAAAGANSDPFVHRYQTRVYMPNVLGAWRD